jgi:hypothetical protein
MRFSLAVHFILTAIKEATKDPKKRAGLRARLIEIRDAITALYAPDEDTAEL